MTIIRQAAFPADSAAVLDIWREYVASPSVSLDFQDNDADFANLPGKYGHPHGSLLVAETNGRIVGCISLRMVTVEIAEMKRLYVRPGARGRKIGYRLIEQLIAEARDIGYAEIRLDVLEEFTRARRLYAHFGFAPAEPVTFNPVPGAEFLGLKLR